MSNPDSQKESHPSGRWWTQHLWQITPLQDVFWLTLGFFLMWIGYQLRSIFIPLLIAFAAAYTIEPWLSKLENRWEVRRPMIITGGVIVFTIAAGVGLTLLGPQVVSQVNEFVEKAPKYAETLSTKLKDQLGTGWVEKLQLTSGQSSIDPAGLVSGGVEHAGEAVTVAGNFLASTTYILSCLVLVPIYFLFFTWNYGPLLDRARDLIPSANRDQVLHIAERMDSAVGNFVRGRLTVCAWMMVMFSVGFMISGVPYWFLLGCGTGLLSFIPFTAVFGCALAVLLKWVDASSTGGETTLLQAALWPVATYCVIQLFEGWVLTPWIQSQSMSMNPVTVLVVLMIGGSVAGLYGLLLAIPITGCLKVLSQEILAPKLEAWAADANASG